MGGSVARLQTLRGHRGLAVVGAGAELPARAADPSAVPSPARSPGRPPPPRAHSPVCLPDAPRLPARAPHPAPAPSARGRRAGSESWRGSPGPAPGSARPDRGPVQRAALGPEHHSGACWPADTAPFLPGAGAGALGNPSPPGPRDHLGARVPLGGRGARGGRPLHPSRPWPGGLLPFIFFFLFFGCGLSFLRLLLLNRPAGVGLYLFSEPRGCSFGAGGGRGAGRSVGGGLRGWLGGQPPRCVPAAARARRRASAECIHPSAPASLGRASTANPNLCFGPNLRNLG